jgi:hypothetical protein
MTRSVLGTTALFFIWAASAAAQSLPPSDVAQMLGCLQPITSPNRRFLHLRGRQEVQYVLESGGVPKTSDADLPYQLATVVFYSPDGLRAVVNTGVFTKSGYFLTYSDEYQAVKRRGAWVVEGGEGSIGTYTRVAEFVGSLDSRTKQVLLMKLAATSSCIDERDWNVPGSKYLKKARLVAR